jgi:hypothetical protein
MNTTTVKSRRPFSSADRAIVILHSATAAVLGTIAFVGANDPDWGSLQRTVIVMLATLWAGGIATTTLVARVIANRWVRFAVLAVGPLVGIAVLIASVQ